MTDINPIATTEEVQENFKDVCKQLIPFLEGNNVSDPDLVNDYISNRDVVKLHHTGELTAATVKKKQAEIDQERQKESVADLEDTLHNASREHVDNCKEYEMAGEQQTEDWSTLLLKPSGIDQEFEEMMRKEKQKIEAQKKTDREQLEGEQLAVISAIEEKVNSSYSEQG